MPSSVIANFNNAASGTNLADYVAGTGEVGADFTGSTSFKISSAGRVYNTTGDGVTIYASGIEADPRNFDVEADYIFLGLDKNYMMLMANVSSSTPGTVHYFGGWDNGAQNGTAGWALGVNNAWVGGAPTAFTVVTNQVYRVRLSVRFETETSTRLQLYVDGVLQKETVTTTVLTSGLSGIINLGLNSADDRGWHIDNFEAKPVSSGALTAPTISLTAKTDTTASLTAPEATGGTSPYSYQWYRSTASGTLGSAITGATTRTLNDTGLSPSTSYYYTLRVTDSAATPATADSNQLLVTTNAPAAYKIVCEGDSLTTENYAGAGNGWPKFLQDRLGTALASVAAYAANGNQISDMTTQAPTEIDPLIDTTKGNILIVWGGTNDLGANGVTPDNTYARLVDYCRARRAAGWAGHNKVLVCTLTSASYGTGFDGLRNQFNAKVRDNWRYFCDGLIDIARDVRIGEDGSYANSTYFTGDLIHLNSGGNAIVADYAAAIISQLIVGGTPQRNGVFSLRL